jgi:hypothetical protein
LKTLRDCNPQKRRYTAERRQFYLTRGGPSGISQRYVTPFILCRHSAWMLSSLVASVTQRTRDQETGDTSRPIPSFRAPADSKGSIDELAGC